MNGTVVQFRDGISVGRLKGVMAVEVADFTEIERLHDRFCRHVDAQCQAGAAATNTVDRGIVERHGDLAACLKNVSTRRG